MLCFYYLFDLVGRDVDTSAYRYFFVALAVLNINLGSCVAQQSPNQHSLSSYLAYFIFSPTAIMPLTQTLTKPFIDIFVLTWDTTLFLLNLILPSHSPTHVIPVGTPGHVGHWPEYIAPEDSDSRSACPMLNALANHGVLPRDGKNIPFRTLTSTVRQSFNFAPSFCFFVPKFRGGLSGAQVLE
jgi:hypothetical protein